jgi:hypothetical protein
LVLKTEEKSIIKPALAGKHVASATDPQLPAPPKAPEPLKAGSLPASGL